MPWICLKSYKKYNKTKKQVSKLFESNWQIPGLEM